MQLWRAADSEICRFCVSRHFFATSRLSIPAADSGERRRKTAWSFERGASFWRSRADHDARRSACGDASPRDRHLFRAAARDHRQPAARSRAGCFAPRAAAYIYIANGHGAWEAALTNVLSRGDKILVLESGRFARRLGRGGGASSASRSRCCRATGAARCVRPRSKRACGGTRTGAIKAILVAQIDTASGVVNDIAAIGKAIKAARHDALFMVDAVASLGCVPFEMDAWGVDVAMSGSQKGLMTPPGLGFVAANARAPAKRTSEAGLRTPYWDWTARDGDVHYLQICRHAARAPVVRAAPGARHAVRGGAGQRVPAPPPAGGGGAPRRRGVVAEAALVVQHRASRASGPTP